MQEKTVYFLKKSGYNIKDIPVLWKKIDENRHSRLSVVSSHCSSASYQAFLRDVGSYLETGVCRPVLTKGGKVMVFQNRQAAGSAAGNNNPGCRKSRNRDYKELYQFFPRRKNRINGGVKKKMEEVFRSESEYHPQQVVN